MQLKSFIFSLLLLPGLLSAQEGKEADAKKIAYLQAINKLETSFNKAPDKVFLLRDQIIKMMATDIDRNNQLTEKMMKTPGRSDEERRQIQDQMSITAKQKYVKKNFEQLDWDDPKMNHQTALALVRNFMNVMN